MGRLVLRYYPVDGEFSPARSNYGGFGIALWLQPYASSYDPDSPTMGAQGKTVEGEVVVRDGPDYWQPKHASVVQLTLPETIVEGEFVEQEVYLLAEDSETVVPVSLSSLPLDVTVVAGLVGVPEAGDPWNAEGQIAGYAGGAFEIGLYEDDVFHSLTVFWADGGFFQPKADGTSWDNPMLPPQSMTLAYSEDDRLYTATLKTSAPLVAFWTQLLRATEVGLEPAPGPDPGPPLEWGPYTVELVAGTWEGEGTVVGFGPSYGSLSPSTFAISGGRSLELNYFDWQEDGLYIGAPEAYDWVATRVVGEPFGSLLAPADDYAPVTGELVAGQTYTFELTFILSS